MPPRSCGGFGEEVEDAIITDRYRAVELDTHVKLATHVKLDAQVLFDVFVSRPLLDRVMPLCARRHGLRNQRRRVIRKTPVSLPLLKLASKCPSRILAVVW